MSGVEVVRSRLRRSGRRVKILSFDAEDHLRLDPGPALDPAGLLVSEISVVSGEPAAHGAHHRAVDHELGGVFGPADAVDEEVRVRELRRQIVMVGNNGVQAAGSFFSSRASVIASEISLFRSIEAKIE